MTNKQKKFADLYIKYDNATKAAKEAGYSKKTAYTIGQKLTKKDEIIKYIKKQMDKKDKESIASQEEILRFLTDVARGKIKEEVVTVHGKIEKRTPVKERVRAAELLGKRYMMFTEKINITEDKDSYSKVELEKANQEMVEEFKDDLN